MFAHVLLRSYSLMFCSAHVLLRSCSLMFCSAHVLIILVTRPNHEFRAFLSQPQYVADSYKWNLGLPVESFSLKNLVQVDEMKHELDT